MTDHELASLLCSRLCHDLTGPVGAVANGVELMIEESDVEIREQSLELLIFSTSEVSRRLQFYRLAFGSAGGLDAHTSIAEAQRIASSFLTDRKQELFWPQAFGERQRMPQMGIQLLLNLILLACEALPRGGRVSVSLEQQGDKTNISVGAEGTDARLSLDEVAALKLEILAENLDARTIQPYFTARLVSSMNGILQVEAADEGRIAFSAEMYK